MFRYLYVLLRVIAVSISNVIGVFVVYKETNKIETCNVNDKINA